MHRWLGAGVACGLALVCAGRAAGEVYSAETDALLLTFGSALEITDEDGDQCITDQDFILLMLEKLFEHGVHDEDCNATLDEKDVLIALARELTAMASDFNRSGSVAGDDVNHVLARLGATNITPRAGDVNGDGVVDAADLLETCDRLGQSIELDPLEAAYDMLAPLMPLESWMRDMELPAGEPCHPEPCGSATCKVTCVDPTTGQKWTYRLFMVGFCGSQFEATECCDEVGPFACNCSTTGFDLSCWVQAQGIYITCLIAIPGCSGSCG